MSTETVIRGFFAGVYALILVWGVFQREDQERNGAEGKGQRYLPYIPNRILPWFLATLAILIPLLYGWELSVWVMLDVCFQVFLQICLYYLLLLPVLPLLRRRVNARTCAALWMIPNYLYVTAQAPMKWNYPLWVLRVPGRLIWILLALWLLGFVGVLGGKILSHLRFRRRVLREAVPVTDPELLAVWQAELDRARFTGKLRGLARSPAIRTPLTVGLFRRFAWVLLPREASYTREDLELVLRHEIVHICRDDAWSKFFLAFCTAMCWFNPLMWAAMDRCAEDLELSCDETVLLHGDGEVRRRYAELLLRTAGDQRGFTTCLSASASSLRHRLKSVVSPREKSTGALLVGGVFFLLCVTCGGAALAYGGTTGAEAIYRSRDPESYEMRVYWDAPETWDGWSVHMTCTDPEALEAYLEALPMERMTGRYTLFDQDRTNPVRMADLLLEPLGEYGQLVTLTDRYVRVSVLGRAGRSLIYRLTEPLDWARLEACLEPEAGTP